MVLTSHGTGVCVHHILPGFSPPRYRAYPLTGIRQRR